MVMLSLFKRVFLLGYFSFSTSLYLIFLHADSVPITDSRTLQPSTIVKFVTSNIFLALSRWFFIIMR